MSAQSVPRLDRPTTKLADIEAAVVDVHTLHVLDCVRLPPAKGVVADRARPTLARANDAVLDLVVPPHFQFYADFNNF